MSENFRIEGRQNVNYGGKKTSFKLFEKDLNRFLFAGQYYADGWNRTIDQCIAFALKKREESDA